MVEVDPEAENAEICGVGSSPQRPTPGEYLPQLIPTSQRFLHLPSVHQSPKDLSGACVLCWNSKVLLPYQLPLCLLWLTPTFYKTQAKRQFLLDTFPWDLVYY